jgi:hypothetical protein
MRTGSILSFNNNPVIIIVLGVENGRKRFSKVF